MLMHIENISAQKFLKRCGSISVFQLGAGFNGRKLEIIVNSLEIAMNSTRFFI